MVQRIQSLYLLIGAVIQVLFATGTYFTYVVNKETLKLTGSGIVGLNDRDAGGDMKSFIIGLGLAVLALVTIFLFKNRKQQIKLSKVAGLITVAEIIFLGISYFDAKDKAEGDIQIGYLVFIIPISTILFFLASKAIKKDDELVRSVDRIR